MPRSRCGCSLRPCCSLTRRLAPADAWTAAVGAVADVWTHMSRSGRDAPPGQRSEALGRARLRLDRLQRCERRRTGGFVPLCHAVHDHEGRQRVPLADGAQRLAAAQPLVYALHVVPVLAGQHPQLVAVPACRSSLLLRQHPADHQVVLVWRRRLGPLPAQAFSDWHLMRLTVRQRAQSLPHSQAAATSSPGLSRQTCTTPECRTRSQIT